jgi:DNA-binding NtrC family response regulator
MEAQPDVLVVSNNLEHRKELVRILDALPLNIYIACTIVQAEEVLARHSALMVFCGECCNDGTYQDLLSLLSRQYSTKHVVLMLRPGEWNKYLEALRLGVAEVVHFPLRPTDIELALIRASHDAEKEVAEMPLREELHLPPRQINHALAFGPTGMKASFSVRRNVRNFPTKPQ